MTGYTEIQLLQQDSHSQLFLHIPSIVTVHRNQRKNGHGESTWREQNQKEKPNKPQNKREPRSPILTNQYLELRKNRKKSTRRWLNPCGGRRLTPFWWGWMQLWDTHCAAFKCSYLALITPYGIIKFQFQNKAWNSSDWHILNAFERGCEFLVLGVRKTALEEYISYLKLIQIGYFSKRNTKIISHYNDRQ